ncbi:sensor domain-containing diguanylate cyclase [Photobacterium japonica]|uniref:GGDEF domain-containing protein n=1 Tax=Photobacterium japonica TaxID=2910235 RepID=UPI003D120F1F
MHYERFFNGAACGLLICKNDPYSTIVSANDAFYTLVGYTREEMHRLHQDRFAALVVDDLSPILKKVGDSIQEGTVLDYEFRIRHKSGEVLWIHDIATYHADENVFYVVIMNISYRQVALEQVYKTASVDGLTGLLNRYYLEAAIQDKLNTASPSPSALLLIDLDNFKQVNDTYGHVVGDRLLLDVSQKLAGLFGDSGILGRLGGDEFLVFLPHVPSAARLAKIAQQVVMQLQFMTQAIPVSASVGVCFDVEGTASFSGLYRDADDALYAVKRAGKAGYVLVEQGGTVIPTAP